MAGNTSEIMLVRPGTIVIPTDGSEYSEGAIREGIKLAKNSSSKLRALYVIEFNPEYEALAPNLVEQEERTAQDILKAVKDRAEKEGVECTAAMVRNEKPFEAIVDEVEESRANLIVMGRRGRTGIKKLLMGSVTAKVIGYSPVDVLVVPKAASLACKNILVATDGSLCAKDAVSAAAGTAKNCGAGLTVIAVIPSENVSALDIVHSDMQRKMISDAEMQMAEKNMVEAKEIAVKAGVSAKGIIASGKPYEQIVETANEMKADLIVVGCHGRTGLARALMGSVTERVIGLAQSAVLVVVEKKK